MNTNLLRKDVLQIAKSIVIKYGWNDNLLINISKNSKFNHSEIQVLFPRGYKSLLQLYLHEINEKMILKSRNIDLIRLKLHERIRELIILRLKIMLIEKKLISKTFLFLLLPQNYKFSIINLYKTVDEIWYLAGDNSTNFNFYSKRAILGSIYTSVMIHFINNNNIDDTIEILNKQLKKVSKIPKIKNRVNDIIKLLPRMLKFNKKFTFIKR